MISPLASRSVTPGDLEEHRPCQFDFVIMLTLANKLNQDSFVLVGNGEACLKHSNSANSLLMVWFIQATMMHNNVTVQRKLFKAYAGNAWD